MKGSILKSIFFLLFASFFWLSCGPSPCSLASAEADSNRITELGEIHSADPNDEEKCQDFVDAIRQFVEDYKDCEDVNQEALDSIEDSIADLPCG